ncbi:Uncharacterised protein [Mycobacteroides abscessus subsp. abscessus]|nr:Uncharacterised protein [Mycobacteroides abscessus subsp. abscessus]
MPYMFTSTGPGRPAPAMRSAYQRVTCAKSSASPAKTMYRTDDDNSSEATDVSPRGRTAAAS